MALVSTFELLVKRIAPTNGVPPIVATAFRRVVQGYFLTIGNPNERDVRLRVDARIPTTNYDPAFDRELVSGTANTRNHIFTYDVTGGVNNGQVLYNDMIGLGTYCDGNQKLFSTGTIKLEACKTGAVKILPDIGSANLAATLTNPQLEIRGYIEIVQIKRAVYITLPDGSIEVIFLIPLPVDLLLTPEIRGTVLDNNYLAALSDLDFDQIAYSLPLASGAALVNVSKSVNPLFVFYPVDEFNEALEKIKITGRLNAAGKFNLSDETIKRFDALLSEFGPANPDIKVDLRQYCKSVEEYINENATVEER